IILSVDSGFKSVMRMRPRIAALSTANMVFARDKPSELRDDLNDLLPTEELKKEDKIVIIDLYYVSRKENDPRPTRGFYQYNYNKGKYRISELSKDLKNQATAWLQELRYW